MHAEYKEWLEKQRYQAGSIRTKLARVERIGRHYGNLDDHFADDQFKSLLDDLAYSRGDERQSSANTSKIVIDGRICSGLASLRSAIRLYARFLHREVLETPFQPAAAQETMTAIDDDAQMETRLGLERDLQAAIRRDMETLEPGLKIIDQGIERVVPSGRNDITALGIDNTLVLIKLKAGTATRQAIGQILSYMGDVTSLEDLQVRGLLVASDFDAGALAAASMVPSLILKRYSIRFRFSNALP